jgi:predicted enzyme related to lactoylglutathione lyase
VPAGRNDALVFAVPDVDAAYAGLCAEAPGIVMESPPVRRPWGAYSFRFTDPDGNTLAVLLQPPA